MKILIYYAKNMSEIEAHEEQENQINKCIEPYRLVMISIKCCFCGINNGNICKFDDDIFFGWIACEECKDDFEYSKNIYKEKMEIYTLKMFGIQEDKLFKVQRSSGEIQENCKAKYIKIYDGILHIDMIFDGMSNTQDSSSKIESLTKSIPLKDFFELNYPEKFPLLDIQMLDEHVIKYNMRIASYIEAMQSICERNTEQELSLFI